MRGRGKYYNRKTKINGTTFASKSESKRFQELQLLERDGQIYSLQLQPSFELQPSFKKNGKTIRAIHYIADFSYVDSDGNIIVEDVKSAYTAKDPIFRIKKKLFEYLYPHLTIAEVIQ